MPTKGALAGRRAKVVVVATVFGGIALAIGIGVWMSADDGTVSPQSRSTETDQLRTLLVFERGSRPLPSAPGSAMRARLVKGKVPSGETVATVETDEDCAPDGEGISHCLNKLRLKDGSQLQVRHGHDMSEVPCMSPGERVRVKAA